MNEAIRIAIEKGGYKGEGARFNFYDELMGSAGWYLADNYAEWENLEVIILDPLFWQALGKALGWSENSHSVGGWYRQSILWFEMHMEGEGDNYWKGLPK